MKAPWKNEINIYYCRYSGVYIYIYIYIIIYEYIIIYIYNIYSYFYRHFCLTFKRSGLTKFTRVTILHTNK